MAKKLISAGPTKKQANDFIQALNAATKHATPEEAAKFAKDKNDFLHLMAQNRKSAERIHRSVVGVIEEVMAEVAKALLGDQSPAFVEVIASKLSKLPVGSVEYADPKAIRGTVELLKKAADGFETAGRSETIVEAEKLAKRVVADTERLRAKLKK